MHAGGAERPRLGAPRHSREGGWQSTVVRWFETRVLIPAGLLGLLVSGALLVRLWWLDPPAPATLPLPQPAALEPTGNATATRPPVGTPALPPATAATRLPTPGAPQMGTGPTPTPA